ncbi:MAG: aminodeoxychorismate synthase component I [Melioribacteraceae bacterium]|nr:aminodeoxychorismate synthase component I [Melioribacteraceae bacterium]MCF8352960.1 aminodeoxychorismate synthase component I [Melioribacteraceae bacterium]MCF8395833.1 aminodeoxychorismate synthase component I [Melioribacteraceae bacterium]MCF8417477.1 aminodeoxychorismate synthase component I [Melioribacteraceae bacterium]
MQNINDILKVIETNSNSAFFFTPAVYPDAKCYFVTEIERIITCNNFEKIERTIDEIDKLIELGLIGFGFISYETGYNFEERLNKFYPGNCNFPLIYFGFCKKENLQIIDTNKLNFENAKGILKKEENLIDNFTLNVEKEEYIRNVKKIKRYIENGDTYQVNYTIKGKFDCRQSPAEIFANLIFQQSAAYSAFINIEDHYILSASPELFYRIDNGKIFAKPMKGTIKKGLNDKSNNENKKKLIDSLKDRAENIMIVDLLRNDLGRVSELNSVTVPNQFIIEDYETLNQMISSVEGELTSSKYSEVIRNLFPCGSITGAPKIRTMEIINELEKESRNIYTGAIGMVSQNHSVFNVAIRTLLIEKESMKGEIGIGSGVVWDSDPNSEYDEVILKSAYLTNPVKYFELFETMLIENGEIFLINYHIKRLQSAADYFLFVYDESKIQRIISQVLDEINSNKNYRLKIILDKWGSLRYEISEVGKKIVSGDVVLSSNKINSSEPFQYFKTTNRHLYDSEFNKFHKEGITDIIYLNENEMLAEGSITNLAVKIGDEYYTPPIESGILNGCYRQYLLDKKFMTEKEISFDELFGAEELLIFNSVKKKLKVRRILDENFTLLKEFECGKD